MVTSRSVGSRTSGAVPGKRQDGVSGGHHVQRIADLGFAADPRLSPGRPSGASPRTPTPTWRSTQSARLCSRRQPSSARS